MYISWKHPVETHKASGTQSAHMLLMLQPPQSLFQFKPTSVRQATHFARQLATFLTVLFHSSPWQKHGTAAQTVFKPARWCCFSRNLQYQHHYRIPLSINPMCLFLTIGALSPGFWHRNCQWHSPMNGFEWLREKPLLSSHAWSFETLLANL